MLRFCSLGSGSTGNATVIEAASGATRSRLLVDCGFNMKQMALRLGRMGLLPGDIDALFVTHEHSDHIGHARAFALRHRLPVWMSWGTYQAHGSQDFDGLLRIVRDGDTLAIGDLQALPFTVPHDAREPLQLSCSDGAVRLGLLTDLGHATAHVMQHLRGANALLLESNHCPDMLAQGGYPVFLQRRVGGMYGHLANPAAAAIARELQHDGLRRVVAAHISRQNNTPALARAGLAAALGRDEADVDVADYVNGTPWLTV